MNREEIVNQKRIRIAPSILAADLCCLGDEIQRAVDGGADAMHVDIMDYHFVPNLSFGPNIVKTVRKLTDLPLDVHLMVDNPLDMIHSFADAGSDYLTVHIEVLDNVPKVLGAIASKGIKPGLSLKPDTPASAVIPFLRHIDILLVMSVFPGFGGQSFMDESLERIRNIAEAAREKNESILISVDGGVNFKNAPRIVKAGANHLVAGTTVFQDHNAIANIGKLRELVQTR